MQIDVRNSEGDVVESIELQDDVFGVPVNESLVHQVVVGQLANARQGTSKTKTRSERSGGGRKPRPQKHTGLSRAGTTRAPQWRKGGVVFGPHPRDFRHRTPKRMKRQALLMSLSAKVGEGQLVVIESLDISAPKTGEFKKILDALETETSTLVVADRADPLLIRAGRNIPGLRMLPATLLNTLDLVNHRTVVMTSDAVRQVEEAWGGGVSRRKEVATAA